MSILKRDLEVYSESQLDPILRPMVAQVLRKRPKDVVTFMLDYLTKYKADHSHTVPATRSHSPDQKASRFTRRTGFSAEALTMDEVSTHTFRVIPKTSEERQSIRDAVQHNFLFGALDEDQFRVVVDAMERKGYRKNDAIITQGEAGDEFFILEKGRTACYLNQYSPPKCCKKYERGEGFGELALMYSQPRQASIIAEEDCVLWALDRPTFQQVVMRGMAAKRAEYERFLLSLPVLSSLDEYEHTVLADDLRKQSFEEGALIVTAGDKPQDPADCRFYFVLTGQCVATKRVQVGEETDTVVCTYYGKGDFFGELLVLGDVQERQYSVQAHGGACEVVFLDKVSFEKCLSPNRSVVEELRAKRKSTRLADEARQIASGV